MVHLGTCIMPQTDYCSCEFYLSYKAVDGELLCHSIPGLFVDNVHTAKNDAPEPWQSQQHDGTTSQGPVIRRCVHV